MSPNVRSSHSVLLCEKGVLMLKVNSRDCVSLSTTCNKPKIFFKVFSGVLWMNMVFVCCNSIAFSVIISKSSGKGQKQPRKLILWKKLFLKILQYSQENTFVGVSFYGSLRPDGLKLFKKETPTRVFSCEYCITFTNKTVFKCNKSSASL